MWCCSDARLRYYFSAFSARGVIQTLVWHQYYYFCIFRSRSHSDTRLAPVLLFYLHPFEESFQTLNQRILFLLPYCMLIFYLLASIMDFIYFATDVVIISISEHDYLLLYYTRVHDVCEYMQTYSLACPWLLSWPDSLRGGERHDDSPGTYAMMIVASRR